MAGNGKKDVLGTLAAIAFFIAVLWFGYQIYFGK